MNIYAMKKPKRINSVSIGLGLIALALVYLAWALLPVMWPLWQMSGIMRSACASAYREKDDEEVMRRLLADAQRTRLKISEDNFRFERLPYAPEELQEANASLRDRMMTFGRECVLRFRYVDQYELPLFGVAYRLPYESKVTKDLRPGDKSTNVLYELFYSSCTCTSVSGRSARLASEVRRPPAEKAGM